VELGETNRDEIVELGALEQAKKKMHATQLESHHCRRTQRNPPSLTGRSEALQSAELFWTLNNNRGKKEVLQKCAKLPRSQLPHKPGFETP